MTRSASNRILLYSFAGSVVVNLACVTVLGRSSLLNPLLLPATPAAVAAAKPPLKLGIYRLPAPPPSPAAASEKSAGNGRNSISSDNKAASATLLAKTLALAPGKGNPENPSTAEKGSSARNNSVGSEARGGKNETSSGIGKGAASGTAETAKGQDKDGGSGAQTGRNVASATTGKTSRVPGAGAATAAGAAQKRDAGSAAATARTATPDKRGGNSGGKTGTGTAVAAAGLTNNPLRTGGDEPKNKPGEDAKDNAAPTPGDKEAEKDRKKAGTYIMPKTAKMWELKPGQKLILPSGLKLVLPKDMPVVPGAAPLTEEQLAQLRKILGSQNLRQMKGLTRDQLKKMLAARKDSEKPRSSRARSLAAAQPTEKRPDKVATDAAKKRRALAAKKPAAPREQSVALMPPGMSSPFRYRMWNPVWQQRYAPSVRDTEPASTLTATAAKERANIAGGKGATGQKAGVANGTKVAQADPKAANTGANPLASPSMLAGGQSGENGKSPAVGVGGNSPGGTSSGIGGNKGGNAANNASGSGGKTPGGTGGGSGQQSAPAGKPGTAAGGGSAAAGKAAGGATGTNGAAGGAPSTTPGKGNGGTTAGSGGGGAQGGKSGTGGKGQSGAGGGQTLGSNGGAAGGGGTPSNGVASGNGKNPAGNGGGQTAGGGGGNAATGTGQQNGGNNGAKNNSSGGSVLGSGSGNGKGQGSGGKGGGSNSTPAGGGGNSSAGGAGSPGNAGKNGGAGGGNGTAAGGGANGDKGGKGGSGSPNGGVAGGGVLGGGKGGSGGGAGSGGKGGSGSGSGGAGGGGGGGTAAGGGSPGGEGGGGAGGGFGGGGAVLSGFDISDVMEAEGIAGEVAEVSGDANGEDTGFAPAQGVSPNFPEHNYDQQNGIPGALVLPPLPPQGTASGKNPTPRPVKRAISATLAAPTVKPVLSLPQTQPPRKASVRVAAAPSPRPQKRLYTVVGSASQRGTVPVTVVLSATGTSPRSIKGDLATAQGDPESRANRRPAARPTAGSKATRERSVASVPPDARQATRERRVSNSQGVRDGSKNPLPPTPLPDSDAEIGDGSGLRGEYYLGRNFEQFQFTRADKNLDLFWGGDRSPSPRLPVGADWSCRWTGRIQPRFSGRYTIYAVADDGVRVWVNHKLIIDDWTLHALLEYSGTIFLEAGKQYDIRVDYFESGGPPASVGVYWESDKQKKEFIPEECLFYPLAGEKIDLGKYEKPRG